MDRGKEPRAGTSGGEQVLVPLKKTRRARMRQGSACVRQEAAFPHHHNPRSSPSALPIGARRTSMPPAYIHARMVDASGEERSSSSSLAPEAGGSQGFDGWPARSPRSADGAEDGSAGLFSEDGDFDLAPHLLAARQGHEAEDDAPSAREAEDEFDAGDWLVLDGREASCRGGGFTSATGLPRGRQYGQCLRVGVG